MRFRIRTSQGQELSFASEAMFEDFVRSGEVSPDDLIYDGATGEWAPARTHTLIIELEAEGAAADDRASQEETDAPGPDGAEADPSFGLSLAEATTPDEAAAAFVAEMEAERSTDFDQVAALEGLRVDQSGAGIVEGIIAPSKRRDGPMSFGRERDLEGPGSSRWSDEPRRATPKRGPSKPAKKSLPLGAVVMGIVGIVVGVAAVLIGPDVLSTVQQQIEDPPPAVVPDSEPQPTIPDTEEALRARATELLLRTFRSELSTLRPIPDIWLDGAYLSMASAYPDVRDVWQEYLEVIRDLRARESELYTTAYLGALDDARVMTPATRTLRLAAAVGAFGADVVHREGHYTRVDELVSAALVLHDLLLELEGSITYEPAQGPSLSADPVIQAVGRDEETQQRLNDALDRVLDALSADGLGPVDADLVPSWVLEGFREVIAP